MCWCEYNRRQSRLFEKRLSKVPHLKSANETEYWLKLIKETLVLEEQSEDINSLLKETDELIRILVAIIVRTKKLEVKS
ncbi:four helix bundle protein [Sphingobacterium chungjuense]|uniref:four helix bundle protein n=1 Tax=Sphingobacterium chungjuense TaxID=2675553 RepID=UPI003743BCE6